jgi:predicted DNA-binding transcriptional regulator AlpA|tara:strand:+ start:275 stop:493 length:219 start_codon:yes stop_codon:yes gene_type:complete
MEVFKALLDKYGSSLTSQQLAGFLCLSIHTITDYRRKGIGPKYLRIGRSIRYKLEDVLQWRENNEVNPAGDE